MDGEGLRQWLIVNYNSAFFLANSYHAQRPALKGSFSFHIKTELNGTYGSVSTLAKKKGGVAVGSWIDSEELCQKIKTLQALWMSLVIHGTLLLFHVMARMTRIHIDITVNYRCVDIWRNGHISGDSRHTVYRIQQKRLMGLCLDKIKWTAIFVKIHLQHRVLSV